MPDTASVTLLFGHDAVVLVGGVPGAGKTRLLERAVRPGEAAVLDSAEVRRALRARLGRGVPYALYRPAVHAIHLWRVWRTLRKDGPVVIHDCATRGPFRRALLRRARRAGRPVSLILLHVDEGVARRRQWARGRVVRPRAMRRHVRRYGAMVAIEPALRPQDRLLAEGYAGVHVLDAASAGRVRELRFAGRAGAEASSPAAAPQPGPAATAAA
jgi:predicted kinase